MAITILSKTPINTPNKVAIASTPKPLVVAPTPKPQPSLLSQGLDAANNFGKDSVTGRPLWQRFLDSSPEIKARGVEPTRTESTPLLPGLDKKFDNANDTISNYAGLHASTPDSAWYEAFTNSLGLETAKAGYNYLRTALTPEGLIGQSGTKRLNLPKTFEKAGTSPLKINLPKAVDGVTPEPAPYNVTKTYGDVNPQNKAKDTLLAYALQASDNPEQVLYPRGPEPTGFAKYQQADDLVQNEVKAKQAKADAKFKAFMTPSGQPEIPASPWSTRMSTEAIPGNIPVGKDGPLYQTIPRQLYPRRAQTVEEALVPERLKVEPPPVPKEEPPKISVISPSGEEPVIKTTSDTPLAKGGKITIKSKTPYAGGTAIPEGAPEIPKVPEVAPTSQETQELSGKFKSKPKEANKNAFVRWAIKYKAAEKHGSFTNEDFADLSDPDLIAKYQQGDRTGRLADVEKLTDEHFQRERAAGLFQGDKGKKNYLRQYWKRGNPEEESTTLGQGTTLKQKPDFTKQSTHQSYAEGEASGLTKKYDTLPEILARREFESKQALANKELYDYLKSTNQLAKKKGAYVNLRDPGSWSVQGPHKDQILKYFKNVTTNNSPDWLTFAKEFASRTKNLYLGGGIPYTPLNIHGYNIARAETDSRGLVGAWNNIRGTVNPAHDVETLKRVRPLIRKMIDYGYTTHSENLPTSKMDELLDKNFATRTANKVMHKTEEIFEDPLFQVRMPAAKAELAEKLYNEAKSKGISEEKALKRAAELSNTFFGGMQSESVFGPHVLRSGITKSLSQVAFLAPDWAETQATRGWRELKALVGKEDSLYAKSFTRAVGRRVAAGTLSTAAVAAGLKKSDKASASENVPIGKTASGKSRELQTYGTANENLRIPEHVLQGVREGDLSPLTDLLKNRLSQPAKTAAHVVFNMDDFNNRLSGRDQYGKAIPMDTAVKNYLTELGAPLEPQLVQALVQYARGKQGEEETASQALEFPVTYRNQPKAKPGPMSVRMPKMR